MQRHDFDPITFIFGVVFTGLGILFMIGRFGVLNHAQWVWPGLLVLLGLAVLVGARGRGGARAARPAFEPRAGGIDPDLEDELLHAPIRTIDSEHLADTSTMFSLGSGTSAAAPAAAPPREEAEAEEAGEPDEPTAGRAEAPGEAKGSGDAEEATVHEVPGEPAAGSRTEVLPGEDSSEDSSTEVLPKVDPQADTTVLPRREGRQD